MLPSLRQLITLAILLLIGSAGLLRAADNVGMTISFDLIDSSAPSVSFDAVTPSPRPSVPAPIRFTFTEEIMNLDLSDFELRRNGTFISLAGANITQISTTVYEIDLGFIPSADGIYQLTLLASSDVTDLFSKSLLADGGSSWVMSTVAPALTTAITRDTDADGYLDTIEISFSKPILDSSIEITDFAVAGYGILSISSGTTANDEHLIIHLAKSSMGDTGATPSITYTPSGSHDLRDTDSIAVSGFTAGSSDGAGPAIISAQTSSLNLIDIIFSESLNDTTFSVNDVLISGFTRAALNGIPDGWATQSTNDNTLQIIISSTIGENDSGYIRLQSTVSDLIGNVSTQNTAVPITDGITDTDAARPLILQSAPPEAIFDVEWIYNIQLDVSDINIANPNCEFILFGDVPTGMTLTKNSALTAEIRWTPNTNDHVASMHYRFGVLVTETVSGRSTIIPLIITINPASGNN